MSEEVATFRGTSISRSASGVDICCMKPEYRDCLEQAMEEWEEHRRRLPATLNGQPYEPGIYAFAYWLIRWSGLVQPTTRRD